MRDREFEILLSAQLSPEFPYVLQWHDELATTMDQARAELRSDSSITALIVGTHRQSAGRGQHGRTWMPPKIGLYATYAFRSGSGLSNFVGFSVALGSEISKALSPYSSHLGVKWPNDLMIQKDERSEWKKFGGILVEASETAEKKREFLIGVGLNVEGIDPGLPKAAALGDHSKKEIVPLEIFPVIAAAVYRTFKKFEKGEGADLLQQASDCMMLKGRSLEIDSMSILIAGVCTGLTNTGALRLSTDSGLVEVASGTVVSW